MRRGVHVLAIVMVAGAVASPPAGAGPTRAPTARITDLGTLKVKLPPGRKGRIWELVLKVTSSRGEVGSLGVRSLNGASLPPEIRSIAIVTPAHSNKRTARFEVFVAINNLEGSATLAAASFEKVEVYERSQFTGEENSVAMKLEPADCAEAVKIGNRVDAYADQVTVTSQSARYGPYVLYRERSEATQPSSEESVLDNTVRAQCAGYPGVETTTESPTSLQ